MSRLLNDNGAESRASGAVRAVLGPIAPDGWSNPRWHRLFPQLRFGKGLL